MFWVIQENLQNEGAFEGLVQALERQGVQYTVVKVIPFVGELIPDVSPEGLVFACGATTMSKIAARKGWVPGYFEDNLNYELLIKNYGEHMLNHDSVISKIRDVEIPPWDEFFIRPVLDSKQFSGQKMVAEEFMSWQKSILKLEESNVYSNLTGDDIIVMSSLKDIIAEYRFFVVDGKVITGSLYRNRWTVVYSSFVDEYIYEFAQQMVDLWSPNRAFCLDVCDTPDGLKVLEINSINSAGFYALDMGKFVNAIESMEY